MSGDREDAIVAAVEAMWRIESNTLLAVANVATATGWLVRGDSRMAQSVVLQALSEVHEAMTDLRREREAFMDALKLRRESSDGLFL